MKGSFSFIIRDEVLDFDEISGKLRITPTSTLKKGQFLREGVKTQAQHDMWVYEVRVSDFDEPENALEYLLEKLVPAIKEIHHFAGVYSQVTLSAYLRSEYGQMGLILPKELMDKIALLRTGLVIHILSFGRVES